MQLVHFTSLLIICVSSASLLTHATSPNVIFILADDLGWHDVGFHDSIIRTPNIDQLAREGVRLNNYYVQSVCTPTRAALMTGRYPIRYGFQHWVITPGEPRSLPLNETLLTQLMGSAGYVVQCIGKWDLGYNTWAATPTYRGCDHFLGYYNGGEDYYTHVQRKWNEVGDKPEGYDFRRDEEVAWDAAGKYSGLLFTEEAVDVIENHDVKRPLFMYLAYQSVHSPREVPASYVKPYEGVIEDDIRRNYAGMVSVLDEGVGNITRALQKRGMMDNTVIIFSTDNGGPTKDTPGGNYAGANNFPFRECKHTLWEGGVKATGLVWAPPSMIRGGRDLEELMHVTDWLPTISRVAGKDVPSSLTLDGHDMWSSIAMGTQGSRKEVLLNIDSKHDSGSDAGLIRGEWKFLRGLPGVSLCRISVIKHSTSWSIFALSSWHVV